MGPNPSLNHRTRYGGPVSSHVSRHNTPSRWLLPVAPPPPLPNPTVNKLLRVLVLVTGTVLVVLFTLSAWKTGKTFTALQAGTFALVTATIYRQLKSPPRERKAVTEEPVEIARRKRQYLLGSAVGVVFALLIAQLVTWSLKQ